uniref:Palmitoyltransferase n=1 Tax=Trichobilharzia regenti TaxID=157069 RepID=A0AA85K624_TRIRE|nr:unnamed protein product [Trichobilharzia regenti]
MRFLRDYIYLIKLLIRFYAPDLFTIKPDRKFIHQSSIITGCIIWLFELISNIYTTVVLEPILNCFSLYLGGRKNFGRTLVALVLTYLCLIISLLYIYLIPRRLSILYSCYVYFEYNSLKCSAYCEGFWLILHFVCSHLLIINVYFHYLCAIFINPGTVPNILPSNHLNHSYNTVCTRCFITRPMRAHHCVVCKKCILRMDHHCPWTANCIGLYTHRHFYLVLIYMSIGGIYLLTVGWSDFKSYLTEEKQHQVNATAQHSLSESNKFMHIPWKEFFNQLFKACFNFGFIAIPLVCALCTWHTRLISTGETSIDRHINAKFARVLKERGVLYRNPHDFGLFLNWVKFLGLIDKCDADFVQKKESFQLYTFLCKRFISRVLLPSFHPPYDDGFMYELNLPTAESVIQSLAESGMS